MILVEPYEYHGAPFGIRVVRIDDKVTITIDREGTVLVELITTRRSAKNIANEITEALF